MRVVDPDGWTRIVYRVSWRLPTWKPYSVTVLDPAGGSRGSGRAWSRKAGEDLSKLIKWRLQS